MMLLQSPCLIEILGVELRIKFYANVTLAHHPVADVTGYYLCQSLCAAESLVLLYGNATAILAVVYKHKARWFVLYVHLLEILLHSLLLVVGNAHDNDVAVQCQVTYLMLENLLLLSLAM